MPPRRFNFPSIAWELTAINMSVSGIALLLAAVALGIYDRSSFRESAVRNLSVRAQIMASNSASALLFNDEDDAAATLGVLRAAPNVLSAAIYYPEGRPLASYQRDRGNSTLPPPVIASGQDEADEFQPDRMVVARRIVFQGKSIGTVAISSDYQEFDARRNRTLGIMAGVLMASFLLALGLARLLQRGISEPLTGLSNVARKVSLDRDYSVRAPAAGNTAEIRVLIDTFNDMLGHIEQGNRALREAHDQLEERVRQRTAELDATNKELESFSYSVSHDLRAPLRHITGFSALLQKSAGDRLPELDRRYLTTIDRAAQRMGRLIDDLLAFSRMGRSALERRRVRLDALVDDARQEAVGTATPPRPIAWRVHPLPEIDADPAMLQLALVNLLSNAVKYTSTREHPEIEIGVVPGRPDETVVFVKDNGVGFDMKYVEKLFGVFQRLHSSDQFEGTGIGLANVRRIIARHGGRVWAEGAVDRGAAFYFSLPNRKRGLV